MHAGHAQENKNQIKAKEKLESSAGDLRGAETKRCLSPLAAPESQQSKKPQLRVVTEVNCQESFEPLLEPQEPGCSTGHSITGQQTEPRHRGSPGSQPLSWHHGAAHGPRAQGARAPCAVLGPCAPGCPHQLGMLRVLQPARAHIGVRAHLPGQDMGPDGGHNVGKRRGASRDRDIPQQRARPRSRHTQKPQHSLAGGECGASSGHAPTGAAWPEASRCPASPHRVLLHLPGPGGGRDRPAAACPRGAGTRRSWSGRQRGPLSPHRCGRAGGRQRSSAPGWPRLAGWQQPPSPRSPPRGRHTLSLRPTAAAGAAREGRGRRGRGRAGPVGTGMGTGGWGREDGDRRMGSPRPGGAGSGHTASPARAGGCWGPASPPRRGTPWSRGPAVALARGGKQPGSRRAAAGDVPAGPRAHNAPIEVPRRGGGAQGGGGRRDSSVTPGLNPGYLYPAGGWPLLHTGGL